MSIYCCICAGSQYALKLMLNIEEYEYMPGLHDDIGVKVNIRAIKQECQANCYPPGHIINSTYLFTACTG